MEEKRVFTVAPLPPEKLAYALARYSRSPDSIVDSIEWVKNHDSSRFLESFYFQYGHASIADLGHVTVCFEGISELAATEIEDEQLWDGQARSSRYQDFSKSEPVVPPEFSAAEAALYRETASELLNAYSVVHEQAVEHLKQTLPCPPDMKPDAYRRALNARAFDVARYLLPFGVRTGVGQVTSIRTLERQMRRFKASAYEELRSLAAELSIACSKPPDCYGGAGTESSEHEPLAPTLARHAEADSHSARVRADLTEWAHDHLPNSNEMETPSGVQLWQPTNSVADICATLLFGVGHHSYADLYRWACEWPPARRNDLLKLVLGSKGNFDEMPRAFRTTPYVAEIIMDIGAYRDLHRHRRCQQFRQEYTNHLGYDTPDLIERCGVSEIYANALNKVDAAFPQLPTPAAQYLLPLAARSRFLFKMDFAELEYIARLRSGVKGHFSYRSIAWQMKEALERLDPTLGALIEATPPSVQDPLKR